MYRRPTLMPAAPNFTQVSLLKAHYNQIWKLSNLRPLYKCQISPLKIPNQLPQPSQNCKPIFFSAIRFSSNNSTHRKMAMLPHFNGSRRGSGDIFDPYAMDLWDPFSLFRDSNRHHGALSTPNSNAYAIANAHIDWKETQEAHIFMADLPGMKKEEVKIEVEEDRVLQISGERGRSEEVTGDQWHRVERSSGKFMRRFRLPENVKVDEIKASMEHGVLTVNVPKVEAKNRSVRAIEISGGI